MSDKSDNKSKPETTKVYARIEGGDPSGRPRLLRLFYPEDGYAAKDDPKGRKHVNVKLPAHLVEVEGE